MLHALVGEHTKRGVWWLHGARNHDEQAFGAEVDELLAELPGSHRVVAYSQPTNGDAPDHDIKGRLDLTIIEGAGVPKDADYYLCGPDGFMRAMAQPSLRGDHSRPDSHRGVRRARRPPLRNRGCRRPDTTRSRGATGYGTERDVLAQQPLRVMGRPIPQPARLRRSLRRAGRFRLSQRDVPQLRKRPARRRGHVQHSNRWNRQPRAECWCAARGRLPS